MKCFTVYDPRTGAIIRSGHCQDHMVHAQARAGESVIERESDPVIHAIDPQTMQLIDKPATVRPELSYAERRLREYPPTGEQLDALWKALHGMPLTAEGEDMRMRIQAVKERHPKP